VLAENEEGYRNLIKITSEPRCTALLQAAREPRNFWLSTPRIDWTFRMPGWRGLREPAGGKFDAAGMPPLFIAICLAR